MLQILLYSINFFLILQPDNYLDLSLKRNIIELFLRIGNKFASQIERCVIGSIPNIYKATVVFVFKSSNTEELNEIRAFLEKVYVKYSKLYVVIINDSTVEIDNYSTTETIFSLNDFNLLGWLKSEKMESLNQNNFNLMISFVNYPDIISETLISNIKSGIKAGPTIQENWKLYDLTIKHKSNELVEQLKQYEHYLSNLKINS